MTICHFTLVLGGVAEIAPELADRLYEATGGDIELNMHAGVATLEFCRAADSLAEAVGQAIIQVERAGGSARVVRVESQDIDSVARINAELLAAAVDAN